MRRVVNVVHISFVGREQEERLSGGIVACSWQSLVGWRTRRIPLLRTVAMQVGGELNVAV